MTDAEFDEREERLQGRVDDLRAEVGTMPAPTADLSAIQALVDSNGNPDLDPVALERALVGGAVDIDQLRDAVRLGRLQVRRLDAAGAVARAKADLSEVVISKLEISPNPPQAGTSPTPTSTSPA